MDHDELRAAQAVRVGALAGQPRLPASRADAPVVAGEPIGVDGAAAVLELIEWPQDAFERVVLGDRTGYLHLVALPDPADGRASGAVGALIAAAAERVGRVTGLRSQLFLRWPSADAAMHPLLERAGLQVDAVWSSRPVAPSRAAGASDVQVRPGEPRDAAVVGDLAVEELRYHLDLTPFTRDVPVVRPWMSAAVTAPDPAVPVFVAERAGEILAYAACRLVDTPDDGLVRIAPPGRAGHFLSVGVRAGARGNGVGSALVRAAATALAAAGAERFTAAFVPGNPLAAPFWRGRGFAPVWHYYAAIV